MRNTCSQGVRTFRQICDQRAQHRMFAVSGMRAEQAFAPFARLLGLVLRGALRVGRRAEVRVAAHRPWPSARADFGPSMRWAAIHRCRVIADGRRCGVPALAVRIATAGATRVAAFAAVVRRAAVIDGAVQLLDVPLQERCLDGLIDAERTRQQIVEEHRCVRQRDPRQVIECAVDDRVRAEIEEREVDIADQLLQVEETLGMA